MINDRIAKLKILLLLISTDHFFARPWTLRVYQRVIIFGKYYSKHVYVNFHLRGLRDTGKDM